MYASSIFVLLASVATGLALIVPELWFCAPLGLALLYLAIDFAQTRNEAFIISLIFGTTTGGAAIWWAWDALPFLWLGYTSPWEGAYVILIIWGLVALGLAVPIALYGAVLWAFRNVRLYPALIVLLWPVAEWGRMWSFALLAAGENALIGPHFSFAALGYLLVDTPFLHMAHVGGVYMLSFLVAGIGMCIYVLLRQASGWQWWALGAVLVLCTSSTYTYTATKVQPLKLALVHTVRHDPPLLPMSYSSALKEAKGSDVVIFPEDLLMFASSTLSDVSTNSLDDGLIVFPYKESGEGELFRTFVVFADKHGVQAKFQKQFLMPEGEYSPFLSQWIFRLIGDPRVEGYFGSARRLMQGPEAKPLSYEHLLIRGRMCSDIISPELTPALSTDSPSLIINIGDQTWFNSSRLLHQRLKQIARVRAVETGSYVLVANRGSPSYAIDPYGTLLKESAWDTEGILYVDLR